MFSVQALSHPTSPTGFLNDPARHKVKKLTKGQAEFRVLILKVFDVIGFLQITLSVMAIEFTDCSRQASGLAAIYIAMILNRMVAMGRKPTFKRAR